MLEGSRGSERRHSNSWVAVREAVMRMITFPESSDLAQKLSFPLGVTGEIPTFGKRCQSGSLFPHFGPEVNAAQVLFCSGLHLPTAGDIVARRSAKVESFAHFMVPGC